MLLFIPSILTALAVVREKELGSITNLYVTPVTRLEFLLGKQLPYLAVAMFSFFVLVALAVFVFRVPLKGSLAALTMGALLYVVTATGFGLLMSAFTRTQIAALFGTAIATLTPATQFSGLTDPGLVTGRGRARDRQRLPHDLLPHRQPRHVQQGARLRRPRRARSSPSPPSSRW